MNEIRPQLTADLQLTREKMVAASRADQMEFRTVEGLTWGLEIPLPLGHSFSDKDGHTRHNVRIRWWDAQATSYRALALMPKEAQEQLPGVLPVNLLEPRVS